jgi:hypothetical protein
VPDRDESIERMLRRVMADDVPPRQEACLDAETIAAWSEGSLHRADAAAAERHVSGCARCRALVAALVRTAPTQPIADSLWRRWHLGWVVPLATAATAAAIWVALPDNGATPASSDMIQTMARDERTNVPSLERPEEPTRAAASPQATASATPRPQQKAQAAESANRELLARSAEAGAPPPADAAAGAAAAAPVVIAPAPAPPAALAERAEADSRREGAASSPFAPLAAQRGAFAGSNQIVSSDGSARWRIVNGQQVERSTDAGAQWNPVAISSPDRLNAAAAPSATVCWIVGARGAVYLTTDGARFTRVPFTELADLTSIFATDALSATVTSADGRSWRTTDQGKTWAITR